MRTPLIAAALATTTLGIGAAQAQTSASQPNPDVQGTTTSATQPFATLSVSEQTVTGIQNALLQLELALLSQNQAAFEESNGRIRAGAATTTGR